MYRRKVRRLFFPVGGRDFLRVIGSFSVEWKNRKLKGMYRGARQFMKWSAEVRIRALELRKERGWGAPNREGSLQRI